jgi:hypothetical protein
VSGPTRAVVLLRIGATLGAAAMGVTIVWALASGIPLSTDGAVLMALVWGRVTLVDLGLALVASWAWIAWREASVRRALAWLVVVAITGSGGILAYVALAAWRAHDVSEVMTRPSQHTV